MHPNIDNSNRAQDRLARSATERNRQRASQFSDDPQAEREEEDEEDQVPQRTPSQTPYVTYGMLGLIALIFALMYHFGGGDVSSVSLEFGAKDNELIRQGQWWRLVTPIFLHGNFVHLLVNSLSLWQLGGSLERIYGSRKFFLIYMGAGIAGNLLSFQFSPTQSLGASGALFGLIGAGLVFPIKFRNLIPVANRNKILSQLGMITIFNLGLGYSMRGIVDNSAHIGGLIGGALVALFLVPDALEVVPPSRMNVYAIKLSTAAFIVITLLSAGLQWQNRNVSRLPALVAYSPQMADPWWSIGLPKRWVGKNGVWTTPEGAVVKISSSDQDQNAAIEATQLVNSKEPFNLSIDGMGGWRLNEQNDKFVRQRYCILAYGKALAVTLVSTPAAYTSNVQRDMAQALGSLRIIHPAQQ